MPASSKKPESTPLSRGDFARLMAETEFGDSFPSDGSDHFHDRTPDEVAAARVSMQGKQEEPTTRTERLAKAMPRGAR